jgi:hypothetical protein
MPEMVGDSNGLIHQRGDAAHLAGHVEKLEKLGPIARRDMGRSGRKWLLANTNVDSWTAQLFDIVRYAAQSGQHNI